MIHQRTKDIFFCGVNLYSRLQYPFSKIKFRNSRNLRLNAGCGKNKIKGFLSIDGNFLARPDLVYDLRVKLPFKENSAEIIYASNIFEHFYHDELSSTLKEFYRIIKVGGVLRIVVPDLEKAVDAYLNKNYNFYSDFPRSFKSIGGRFANLIFCDGQHRTAFDFDFIKEILVMSGFPLENIHQSYFENSLMEKNIYKTIEPYEAHYKETCLFIEAQK